MLVLMVVPLYSMSPALIKISELRETTATNLFITDASTDRIGIGTATPSVTYWI